MTIDPSDDRSSNPRAGSEVAFPDLVDQAITRRDALKSGLGAAAVGFIASVGVAGCTSSNSGNANANALIAASLISAQANAPKAETMLGFTAVAASSGDVVVVPAGYIAEVIIPWGEPINAFAPAWNPDASQGWQEQEQQVGDNHDGMHFFPIAGTPNEGLLALNHEYINPEYFYQPGGDPADWLLPFTFDKVRKGLAGHGVSVVHLSRGSDRRWSHKKNSPYNRRITGYTPMVFSGPAAGHPLMQTAADPTGRSVLGTLNNCAHGYTPWGTYLTCEENFNGYFGWNGSRTPSAMESRYGLTANGFGYRWHTADPRFDLNATPNEPNRFGWVVEIDPFNPGSTPVKHTALGRFKHENAAHVVAPNGKMVVYMGDDERNEYIYKFVSDGTFNASNPSDPAHRNLLGSGTLYVAVLAGGPTAGDNAGIGTWVPLIYGQNGLTDANGFTSQADVLIRTRQAADRVGATMMDRPEWVAVNPKRMGEAMITMTNNSNRGGTPASSNNPDGSSAASSSRPPVDESNPRSSNSWGHIIRWNETNNDPTSTTFTWNLFVIAGNPQAFPQPDVRGGSSNISTTNMFNSPDGLAFDSFGRLWIQTDGNFSNAGSFAGMGNNQMLAADPTTGEIRRFLVGPSGCEVTGVVFSPDRTAMFINIQHPGEVGSHPNKPAAFTGDNWLANNPTSFSTWPTPGARPRSATVVIRRSDGGIIAGGEAQPTTTSIAVEVPPTAAV